MQLQIKGKNVEVNDGIRSYAEKKLAKVGKQVHEETTVELVLAAERNPSIAASQVAEATIWLKGHTLHAREAAPDMKAAIDELAEKLLRQVNDEREKRSRRNHRGPDKRESASAS